MIVTVCQYSSSFSFPITSHIFHLNTWKCKLKAPFQTPVRFLKSKVPVRSRKFHWRSYVKDDQKLAFLAICSFFFSSGLFRLALFHPMSSLLRLQSFRGVHCKELFVPIVPVSCQIFLLYFEVDFAQSCKQGQFPSSRMCCLLNSLPLTSCWRQVNATLIYFNIWFFLSILRVA